MKVQERIIKTNGVALNTITIGEGEPVLVVGSAIYYPRTFSESLQQQYKWVFSDCRLFVPTPEKFDMKTPLFDLMADDLEAIRVELELGKVTILGHSIHGLIALEYARRYPESITGVVVIGSPPRLGSAANSVAEAAISAADPERLAIIAQRWEAFGGQEKLAEMHPDETIIPAYLNNGPFYWYDMHFDAAPLWEGVQGNAALVFPLMSNQGAGYDLGQKPLVKAPVFVAIGRHDFVVPYTMWDDAVQSKLPNLTLHLFEKCGHTPQFEVQEDFDTCFNQWMNSH